MLIQVIAGKVKDADLLRRQDERWHQEIEAGAAGYLGYTGGITPDGRSISLVRFSSAESAQANSDRPEQAAWWAETAQAYDGEPTFADCREVDTMFGGGSNDAGFVQVVQGRAKDQDTMRSKLAEMEATLKERRPDILGMIIAWHGDGGGVTQAVYFRSEEETRLQEKATEQDELRQEYTDMFEGPMVFFDLPEPQLY
jgi:hypothetical protein